VAVEFAWRAQLPRVSRMERQPRRRPAATAIQTDVPAVVLMDMPPPGPSIDASPRFGPPQCSLAYQWPLRLSGRPCNGRLAVESSSSEVDVDLVQRIATRDEVALAELYDRHSRLAYSVIVRILGSPSDAEEVLQETFVRVWLRADTYDGLLGSPATWLLRIARNRAIDRLRARRVRANVAVELAVHAGDDAPPSLEPVARDTPETVLEGRTMAGAVRTALATLAPTQRALIEAAFFEGYTHSELATRFGVPLGTVKTRIRTGLAALRGRLEQVI
jgi:RNA polymerase sigma-70 factor, ECF subfamily